MTEDHPLTHKTAELTPTKSLPDLDLESKVATSPGKSEGEKEESEPLIQRELTPIKTYRDDIESKGTLETETSASPDKSEKKEEEEEEEKEEEERHSLIPDTEEQNQDEPKNADKQLLPCDSLSFFVTTMELQSRALAASIFILQIVLLSILFIELCSGEDVEFFESYCSLPPDTTYPIAVAQLFSLLLMTFTQEETILLLEQCRLGCRKELYDEHFSANFETLKKRWNIQLGLRFVLIIAEQSTSILYVLQAPSVANVFLRFATLQFITRLDNWTFVVCEKGIFSRTLWKDAKEIRDAKSNLAEYRYPKEKKTECRSLMGGVLRIYLLFLFISAIVYKHSQLFTKQWRYTQALIAPSDFSTTEAYCKERAGGTNDTYPFLFAIKTGPDSPLGLFWKTTDLNSTETVKSYGGIELEGPQGSYTERNKEYEHSFCIQHTNCFLLTIENYNSNNNTGDLLKYPGAFEVRSNLPIRRVVNGNVSDDVFRGRRYEGLGGKALLGSDAKPYYDNDDYHLFGGGATNHGNCRFLVDQYVIGDHDGLCVAQTILPRINKINQANIKDCENRGGTKRPSIFGRCDRGQQGVCNKEQDGHRALKKEDHTALTNSPSTSPSTAPFSPSISPTSSASPSFLPSTAPSDAPTVSLETLAQYDAEPEAYCVEDECVYCECEY